MLFDLEKKAAELPSIKESARRIAEDLIQGRSVILSYPNGFDYSWILESIRTIFFERDLLYNEIIIPDSTSNCSKYIADVLGLISETGYTPESPSGLIELPDLPEMVLFTSSPDLSPNEVEKWLEFIGKWSRLAHKRANIGQNHTAILLPVSGNITTEMLPDSDLMLSIRYLWGVPSLLESRLLCRQFWREDGYNEFLNLWYEYVYGAVSMGDLNFLAYLWENGRNNRETIQRHILDYAELKNWDLDFSELSNLCNVDAKVSNVYQISPPRRLFPYWSKGIIGFIPERGAFIQTSALALMGLWDEINHRIWSGQAEFLFPLIDAARLRLCDRLTQKYGKSWPTAWVEPASEEEDRLVRNNPRACQWGHLFIIFQRVDKLRKQKNLVNVVNQLRVVRNEMAHYRPIEDQKINRFSAAVSELKLG